MSCNLITVERGHKVARPIGSLEEYVSLRNSPTQVKYVQMARNGDERAKTWLMQVNYSGHYPDGVVKGCKLPSMAFGFDLDDKGEFERVAQLLVKAPSRPKPDRPTPDPSLLEGGGNLALAQCERPSMAVQEGGGPALTQCERPRTAVQEGGGNQCVSEENKLLGSLPREGWGGALTPLGKSLGLLMLERSARQGGHAVFRREAGKTILENQVRIAMALGCEMDTNTHDINRVYFTTTASVEDLLFVSSELFEDGYDEGVVMEEARVLEHRECYHMEELPEGAHSSDKHYRPAPTPGPSPERMEGGGNLVLAQFERPRTAVQEGGPALSQFERPSMAVHEDGGPDTQPAQVYTPLQKGGDGGGSVGGGSAGGLSYLGIPYSQIIAKWWALYNNGQEPITSNRDSLTFELAVNLRHICGFDRELLDRVIPCYDGFPQAQKMKCIDSALAERRTQMPARLKTVLAALRQENITDTKVVQAIDEAELQDDMYYAKRLPKGAMPMGIADSVAAVGPLLTMPVVTAICPAIGALATGVRLDVHGKYNSLNLISYICGEFASSKGDIDPVIDAWMSEIQAQDDLYEMQESEWRKRKRQAMNDKKQPEEPILPIRRLTLNNTVANLAERLARTLGDHGFSYTPEADTVAMKWKSSVGDFSIMLRQSYDASRYDREARSADAVNVHIKHLRWNVTMCGTPDALYRVINNYTDGFQSRVAIARTPDNTFQKLCDNPYILTDSQEENIRQVAHLLPMMKGKIKLNKLEARSRQWVEAVRLNSIKDHDRVQARQRFRVCVTAMRMTACLMLCWVCERLIRQHGLAGAEERLRQNPELWMELMKRAQTPAMLEAYDVIADSLIDNALYFFRDRIEQAYQSRDFCPTNERVRRGKNDTIFAHLELTFTFEQVLHVAVMLKGSAAVTDNMVRMMLKNWQKQGLVCVTADGRYAKT